MLLHVFHPRARNSSLVCEIILRFSISISDWNTVHTFVVDFFVGTPFHLRLGDGLKS